MDPTPIIPAHFTATFPDSKSLRLHLIRHPDVAALLRERNLWSFNEANPLIELCATPMFLVEAANRDWETKLEQEGALLPSEVRPLAPETLLDMAKVLIEEFGVNLDAKLNAYEKENAVAPTSIPLKIETMEDPPFALSEDCGNGIAPLQLCALSQADDTLLGLLLRHGADDAYKGYIDETGCFETARDIATRMESNGAVDLFAAHTEKNSKKDAIDSLTKCIRQKPDLEKKLSESKTVDKLLASEEDSFQGKLTQTLGQLEAKCKEMKRLQGKIELLKEEVERIKDNHVERVSDLMQDQRYQPPATVRLLEGELGKIQDLIRAIQGAGAFVLEPPKEKKKDEKTGDNAAGADSAVAEAEEGFVEYATDYEDDD